MVFAIDYHPFGMQMPNRTDNSPQYRYGFNGKEKDEDQAFGNQTTYDYGFRIYNPGIGKFLSVDPLSQEFPWFTPYQFAGNSPIANIDLDGLENVYYTIAYDDEGNGLPKLINRWDGWIFNLSGLNVHLSVGGKTYKIAGNLYRDRWTQAANALDEFASMSEEDLKTRLASWESIGENKERLSQETVAMQDRVAQYIKGKQGGLIKSVTAPKVPKKHSAAKDKKSQLAKKASATTHSFNGKSFDKASSPLVIPKRATIVEQIKTGYTQVKFSWKRGKFKYEARWHTRTPGAPANQGDSWVVTRTTPGNSQGLRKQQHILTGKYNWTKMSTWQNAVKARQLGTATQKQQELLDNGHHKSE